MALAALAAGCALLPCTVQAAVPDAAPAYQDDSLYPLCDELIPARLREKHLKGMSVLPPVLNSRDTFCDFASGSQSVSVTYRCRKDAAFPTRKLDATKEKEIRGLGRFAYSSSESGKPTVNFLDDDTPCAVLVFSTGGYDVEAMTALARDLATTATPQAVSRPTVVGLVSHPAPATAPAEEVIAAWEKERVAVTSLYKLGAGFPQKVEQLPVLTGDPPRTAFVLGYCARESHPEGGLDRIKKLLPGLTAERFAAGGHPLSCPEGIVGAKFDSTIATEVAGGKLFVNFGTPVGSKLYDSLLLVGLRDPTERLLDWKRIDVLRETSDAKKMLDPTRPEREQTPECIASLKPDAEGAVATIECPLSPDPEFNNVTCKENPMWRLTWKIAGKGDKLSIQRKRIVTKGRGCFDDH
jgi:hypothetical protein